MSRLARQIRILWRSEQIVAEIRASALAGRIALFAAAALAGLCACVTLHIAGFMLLARWLHDELGAIGALAAIDLGLVALLLVIAARRRPATDLPMALEVRDLARQALAAEATGPALLNRALEQLLGDTPANRPARLTGLLVNAIASALLIVFAKRSEAAK